MMVVVVAASMTTMLLMISVSEHVSQGAQSLSMVSALRKVQQMVLCCSSCTPGWSFSNEPSGDALCITCGINKHLLKVEWSFYQLVGDSRS